TDQVVVRHCFRTKLEKLYIQTISLPLEDIGVLIPRRKWVKVSTATRDGAGAGRDLIGRGRFACLLRAMEPLRTPIKFDYSDNESFQDEAIALDPAHFKRVRGRVAWRLIFPWSGTSVVQVLSLTPGTDFPFYLDMTQSPVIG